MKVERIGTDLAKQVFQVHGVDGHGKTRIQKTLGATRWRTSSPTSNVA
jgi:hypothetical protein